MKEQLEWEDEAACQDDSDEPDFAAGGRAFAADRLEHFYAQAANAVQTRSRRTAVADQRWGSARPAIKSRGRGSRGNCSRQPQQAVGATDSAAAADSSCKVLCGNQFAALAAIEDEEI